MRPLFLPSLGAIRRLFGGAPGAGGGGAGASLGEALVEAVNKESVRVRVCEC